MPNCNPCGNHLPVANSEHKHRARAVWASVHIHHLCMNWAIAHCKRSVNILSGSKKGNGSARGLMMRAADAASGDIAADETIVRGTMKWFDPVRGYGFMVPVQADGSSDVLVHYSLVREHGRRSLPEGATITCAVVARDRGRQARRIMISIFPRPLGPIPTRFPAALPTGWIRR